MGGGIRQVLITRGSREKTLCPFPFFMLMYYENIVKGRFIERPNRFIAFCEIDGEIQRCHVKNTGRCKELLTDGATVFLNHVPGEKRKTAYDLIGVIKGDKMINMDSYAPNIVFGEFLKSGGLGFVPDYIKPECTKGDSRFDFYFEHQGKKCFAEVKGVTLEQDGFCRFPDAPTERGAKHMRGLKALIQEGYEAMAVFIIQMEDVKSFSPNYETDPDFAKALKEAADGGVKILAYCCKTTENSLFVDKAVKILL